MALPAKIFFAVARQVDLRRPGDFRVFAMTLSAKFAVGRFRNAYVPRIDLVLLRSGVAGRAFQKRVRRDGLPSLDASMAGAASPRRLWRPRVVRVVASDTGLHRVVNHGIDLREAQGPGRIVHVTERAKLSTLRDLRLHHNRILRMLFRRTMTGLAGQASVITCLLRCVLRRMASATYLGSGILGLSRAFSLHCGRLLQFPFLEGRRQAEPDPRDRPDQYNKDDREPYNLIRNFWQQHSHSRLSS